MSRSSIVGVLAALLCLAGTAAQAGTLSFKFRSNHEYSVGLEFTSQDRNHQWPGDGKAYKIADYEVHSYKLQCQTGETICYGAWLEGDSTQYWCVGMDNENHCSDCCYVCDGSQVQLINLNE